MEFLDASGVRVPCMTARARVLEHEGAAGQPGIGKDHDVRRTRMIRLTAIRLGTSRRARGPRAELVGDQALRQVGIDVADGHHDHAFGAIPRIVEGLQGTRLETPDCVLVADRWETNMARVGPQKREVREFLPAGGRVTILRLAQDNAAFEFDQPRFEGHLVRKFAEDPQSLPKALLGRLRQFQMVDRVVVTGERGGVGTEREAKLLEGGNQRAVRMRARAPKCHVFDEVRHAMLRL